MGFLVRRMLLLMGLGLVATILALNSSARHREMSYGLVALVLQPQIEEKAATVVSAFGTGLMEAPPKRPGENMSGGMINSEDKTRH
jgi:hypothetical protein